MRYTSLVVALLLAGTSGAQAQLSDATKGALGGGGMPSLKDVGVGNLAGVVGYCAKNQFLHGGTVQKVENGLLGKLGGKAKAKSEPGYLEGLGGVLGGKSDQKLDLNSHGIKEKLTDQVCKEVLKYGRSLI